MAKPPAGVDDVFAATMVLLAGTSPSVVTTKAGKVKDRSWDASKKQLLGEFRPTAPYRYVVCRAAGKQFLLTLAVLIPQFQSFTPSFFCERHSEHVQTQPDNLLPLSRD